MFDRILLPVDGSAASERAREYALLLAETYGGEIHALAVLDSSDVPEDGDDASIDDLLEIDVRPTANEAISSVIEAGERADVSVIDSIRSGAPVEEILTYVTENGIDLVVLGTHTPGRLARFLRDSIVEQITQQSPAPVFSVWEAEDPEPVDLQQILLATDGSESALRASEFAFDIATAFDASVRGLYVVESRFGSSGSLHTLLSKEGERVLKELQASGAQAGIHVTPMTREGKPADEILAAAADCNADLIVIGTQGKTGLDRLVMGSVAATVVRRSEQPVLTVRKSLEDWSTE
ncbi:universal stress protein [Haloferax sp. KTX1]|uniref:universal stress protein n=1 Tax=Haloferax sp. KTX1 TaxID=2600597 RepID=UPI0011DE1CC5|nr:universal stress protein [Haloferax sp. KTX1]